MAITTPNIQIEPPPSPGEQSAVPGLRYDGLLDCVHCGICLSACPTYQVLHTEADSPRGRLLYMRALAEGRTDVNPTLVHHIDTCLGCRACETACPSAVQYGELLIHTRQHIERHFQRDPADLRARRTLLDTLTRPRRLIAALASARILEKVPGGAAITGRVRKFLFGPNAPELPMPDELHWRPGRLPERIEARGERRGRVALLTGCVMSVMFHRVNEATARLLAANGVEVVVPQSQGCCGALHMHNGYLAEARERAERLIEAFEAEEYDAIVVNSAGCGSAMKEYRHLFHGDHEWEARAAAFELKVRDVSEYLAALGMAPPARSLDYRVVYHDACHLAHGQQIRSQPRSLLRQIPGLQLTEFVDTDVCCGSAGIYNFLQPEMAAELQARKVEHILEARPDVVVTGNPGCHAWIEAGIRAAGRDVPMLHTVELLAQAYK